MAVLRAGRCRRPTRRAAAGRRWCAASGREQRMTQRVDAGARQGRPEQRGGAGDERCRGAGAGPGRQAVGRGQAGDAVARRGQAALADAEAEAGIRGRRPRRRAGRDRHDPRVPRQRRSADDAVVAGGDHNQRPAARGAIERAGQGRQSGGGGRRQRGADVEDLRAGLDAVLDGGRQRAGGRADVALRIVGEHRPRQQRAARTNRRRVSPRRPTRTPATNVPWLAAAGDDAGRTVPAGISRMRPASKPGWSRAIGPSMRPTRISGRPLVNAIRQSRPTCPSGVATSVRFAAMPMHRGVTACAKTCRAPATVEMAPARHMLTGV